MKVKLIKAYNDLPEGTVLHNVSRNKVKTNEFFAGIWSSSEGSYLVAVPVEYCTKVD